jgi:hypothetical protein
MYTFLTDILQTLRLRIERFLFGIYSIGVLLHGLYELWWYGPCPIKHPGGDNTPSGHRPPSFRTLCSAIGKTLGDERFWNFLSGDEQAYTKQSKV